MARVIVELTNRCNLRCAHCYPERHAATGDLPFSVVETLVREGKSCGIDHLCFSGGEPTIHFRFRNVVERVCKADYTYSFVSNGLTFGKVAPLLVEYRHWFRGVTFSLDGAREATHDRLRGAGSYRHVMRAATLCVFNDLPFTFNMVLTKHNRGEVDEFVRLGGQLGSRGVRFGHLMFTAKTNSQGLELSAAERREVERRIWELKDKANIYVGMAPGYYSDSPFFPCGPLELEEFNVDYRGHLTLCCHLSGYCGENSGSDVFGSLHDISLAEACERFRERVRVYLADKRARVRDHPLSELEHFPCWYCVKYLGKAPPELPLVWPTVRVDGAASTTNVIPLNVLRGAVRGNS